MTTILAGMGDIQVHLRARAGTAEEAETLLEAVAPEIETLLGDRIYSRNGDLLEIVIGKLLRERGATLSVAESCHRRNARRSASHPLRGAPITSWVDS